MLILGLGVSRATYHLLVTSPLTSLTWLVIFLVNSDRRSEKVQSKACQVKQMICQKTFFHRSCAPRY